MGYNFYVHEAQDRELFYYIYSILIWTPQQPIPHHTELGNRIKLNTDAIR